MLSSYGDPLQNMLMLVPVQSGREALDPDYKLDVALPPDSKL